MLVFDLKTMIISTAAPPGRELGEHVEQLKVFNDSEGVRGCDEEL